MRSFIYGIFVFLFLIPSAARAQQHTSASIFAHNDYVSELPFYTAYNNEVGYIEADVFLINGKLLVAHTRAEVDSKKTLEQLYLKPIQEKIRQNNGHAYKKEDQLLTLMIDLKSDGKATLEALAVLLKNYPELTATGTFRICISGNMPTPDSWASYPDYLFFDGRPSLSYTPAQLQRVLMISTGLREYSNWNGKGVLVKSQAERVNEVIRKAHALNKPVRFWATPDFTSAWLKLMEMNVDILNTDHVEQLATFLKQRDRNSYTNKVPHEVYKPITDKSHWKQTPRHVILLIGDGMGLAQLYSGYTANRGKLNIFNIPTIGLSITSSIDSYITDSAAGATAMASGYKTKNRYVGVDSSLNALTSIVEKLEQKNFNTALISNGDITDATPASFYAHQPERSMSEQIAADFVSSKVDILLGGGVRAFTSRKDNRNLFEELKKKGYSVSNQFPSLDTVKHNRFVILDDKAVISKLSGRGDFLVRSLSKTLNVLQAQGAPFFVMAEGAQIDWGGHDNNLAYATTEMLDFDQAVGEALRFADKNGETLVIVTADHETGGLSLLEGKTATGSVHGSFSTTDHTGIPVLVFSYGPGAENFRGVFQNTEINHRIEELLQVNKK